MSGEHDLGCSRCRQPKVNDTDHVDPALDTTCGFRLARQAIGWTVQGLAVFRTITNPDPHPAPGGVPPWWQHATAAERQRAWIARPRKYGTYGIVPAGSDDWEPPGDYYDS